MVDRPLPGRAGRPRVSRSERPEGERTAGLSPAPSGRRGLRGPAAALRASRAGGVRARLRRRPVSSVAVRTVAPRRDRPARPARGRGRGRPHRRTVGEDEAVRAVRETAPSGRSARRPMRRAGPPKEATRPARASVRPDRDGADGAPPTAPDTLSSGARGRPRAPGRLLRGLRERPSDGRAGAAPSTRPPRRAGLAPRHEGGLGGCSHPLLPPARTRSCRCAGGVDRRIRRLPPAGRRRSAPPRPGSVRGRAARSAGSSRRSDREPTGRSRRALPDRLPGPSPGLGEVGAPAASPTTLAAERALQASRPSPQGQPVRKLLPCHPVGPAWQRPPPASASTAARPRAGRPPRNRGAAGGRTPTPPAVREPAPETGDPPAANRPDRPRRGRVRSDGEVAACRPTGAGPGGPDEPWPIARRAAPPPLAATRSAGCGRRKRRPAERPGRRRGEPRSKTPPTPPPSAPTPGSAVPQKDAPPPGRTGRGAAQPAPTLEAIRRAWRRARATIVSVGLA